MNEAERVDMPEEMQGDDAPQETGISTEAAQLDLGSSLDAEAAPETGSSTDAEEAPEGDAEPQAAHALSGATLEAMSRTDPLALAQAEAERTKWDRRKSAARERVYHWCKQYMADGGFKLSVALVTAVIAASIIVIAGIFSDRQLSVVFWRAVIGFFVSGLFMGGALYWLDRIGIPLFIAKHEDQIQMEWLSEAEEAESEEGAQTEGDAEASEEEEALEELLDQEGAPQEGEETSPEDAMAAETEDGEAAEEMPTDGASESEPPSGEEAAAEEGVLPEDENAAETPEGDMGGLEDAVLDDAFASGEAEEEPAEPPTFAPMTADNLESLSVPES